MTTEPEEPQPTITSDEIVRHFTQNGDSTVAMDVEDNILTDVVLSGTLSQPTGEAGWLDLQGGNDRVEASLANDAVGETIIYGGRGQDAVLLRSNSDDGQLVELDEHTKQFIQNTAAGMLKITFKDVEDVQVQHANGTAVEVEKSVVR